ncbi:MAG TPA: ATP-binding protein [Anaerolineales bacterium]|nr:ATP-binding protein [Anaerolineales bacterium]
MLIRETVAAFQSQAAAAGVKLELSLGAGALMLEADPERIRQVLTNLISNALRYSPRGSTIEIHLTESDLSAGRRAVVSVQDSGPGIAPQDLSHVFDRFYRSSDSRGMGLGLSIAKYIVEAHGGEIQAESAEGQGTTIWFSLPA